MTIQLVDPNTPWDITRETATDNQIEGAKAIFTLIQEVRKQRAPDDDSPGVLTPLELLQLALENVPEVAGPIVALTTDETNVVEDVSMVTAMVVSQLVAD